MKCRSVGLYCNCYHDGSCYSWNENAIVSIVTVSYYNNDYTTTPMYIVIVVTSVVIIFLILL